MGIESPDIDIATDALPPLIQELFPKTVAVGLAFGVVVVVLEGIPFEVATFRTDLAYQDGRHPTAIAYSTPEQDAERRDFTINGMFYDPVTERIIDYVGGENDIRRALIRAIGNPATRFAEDRLRMLRAIRFAARFSFTLDAETKQALIAHQATLLPAVSVDRIWQELSKMAKYPHLDRAILLLQEVGLLHTIFPSLATMPVDRITSIVSSFSSFPLDTPPIVYFFQLFSSLSPSVQQEICKEFKMTTKEKKLVAFFSTSERFIQQRNASLYEWAHFYAHPHASLFLQIAAAKLPPPQQELCRKEHAERKAHLLVHINRIQKQTPLLRAAHLQACGIAPGKQMGELLKKGEEYAINENLSTPEEVMHRLGI
jgi:poly(A) polymerase